MKGESICVIVCVCVSDCVYRLSVIVCDCVCVCVCLSPPVSPYLFPLWPLCIVNPQVGHQWSGSIGSVFDYCIHSPDITLTHTHTHTQLSVISLISAGGTHRLSYQFNELLVIINLILPPEQTSSARRWTR